MYARRTHTQHTHTHIESAKKSLSMDIFYGYIAFIYKIRNILRSAKRT